MNAPSSPAPSALVSQPAFYPRVAFSRMIDGAFDVICDGVNPYLGSINFSLEDLPDYADFTSLFQYYCIEKIEIWFRPEYTVLSDASALSNSKNVEFFTAIDLVDSSVPTGGTVLQYQNCAHTSIVKTHYRKFKPAYRLDNVLPACGYVTTSNASLNWLGLKIEVPPTGIAMTFRTVTKFTISCAGVK